MNGEVLTSNFFHVRNPTIEMATDAKVIIFTFVRTYIYCYILKAQLIRQKQ